MEFKKKKRLEERARESREAREKCYKDYHWANLCEDAAKLKKLHVPELNKYLKHHGLSQQHQNSNKNDKVKTIMGHFLRMNTLRAGQAMAISSKFSVEYEKARLVAAKQWWLYHKSVYHMHELFFLFFVFFCTPDVNGIL